MAPPPDLPAVQHGSEAGPSSSVQQSVEEKRLAWVCSVCLRECIPIRSESRCLCGHRHHAHLQGPPWRCTTAKCSCRGFFYIVAEGAWILRCRCKHKHVEHDAASHACTKPGCSCTGFDSPWVCNCDHKWGEHQQVEVAKRRGGGGSSSGLMEAVADINRWDLLQRGQSGGGG